MLQRILPVINRLRNKEETNTLSIKKLMKRITELEIKEKKTLKTQ